MSITQRVVTWGDDLFVKAGRAQGGLNQAVIRIQRVVGPQIGVRNSFAPLFDIKDPANLNEKFAWRAWLLITALGLDPKDWGLYDDAVPQVYADRIEDLQRMLCTPRGSNPEPTDYGLASAANLHPRKRRARDRPQSQHRSTRPTGRTN